MNKEQAILSEKYTTCFMIDSNWGAGDNHLVKLEMLCAKYPDDEVIKKLYEHLKKYSKDYDQRANDPIIRKQHDERYRALHIEIPSIPIYTMEDLKAECVYRDEGKEEAEHYAKLIEEQYGKEYLEKLQYSLY